MPSNKLIFKVLHQVAPGNFSSVLTLFDIFSIMTRHKPKRKKKLPEKMQCSNV
jgi:hypothetical protein